MYSEDLWQCDNVICSVSAWGFIKIMRSHGPVWFFELGPEMRMIMAMTSKMMIGHLLCSRGVMSYCYQRFAHEPQFNFRNSDEILYRLVEMIVTHGLSIVSKHKKVFFLKCQIIDTSFVSWLCESIVILHHYVKSSWCEFCDRLASLM